MQPILVHPIVCIRAQMGLGKTKALIQHIKDTCAPSTSILLVSYNIELCKRLNKMFTEGTGMEFSLYLDEKRGDIVKRRVTVCLDSLCRCAMNRYDVLVIDEVQSVLSHFNSPHMRDTGIVSHKLERYLVSASRTLFVDAVCDSTLVKLVVDRVASLRGCKPLWIINKYVRPSSRRMDLHLATETSRGELTESSLQVRALNATMKRLRDDQNVVHISNTKSHVLVVEAAFKSKYPKEQYAAYYGEGPRKLNDPNEEWPPLRLLTFSPAIIAGISFEGLRFHALTAYIMNSPHAPSIDAVIQMLYRVRDRSEGHMEVFMSTPTLGMHLPHSVSGVTAQLLQGHALTKRYLNDLRVNFEAIRTLEDDGNALYDRTRMSWDILVGINVCRTRSLALAPTLLESTMTEDYGVPVTLHTSSNVPEDAPGIGLDEVHRYAAPPEDVPFSAVDLSVDKMRAADLEASFSNGCDAVA